MIGTYTYDAWGVCTYSFSGSQTTLETSIVLNYNPFRYRGYFYDRETKLYYLQTRYYNPSWCRFISPDEYDVVLLTPDQLTDKNLYAYCDNNPIMRIDADGEFWNFVIGGVVGAVVGGVVAAINGGDVADIVIGAIAGGASGVVAASGLGVLAQAGISAAISATSDIATQTVDIIQSGGDITDYNALKTVNEAVLGFGMSAAGSGLGNLTGKYITGTSKIANQAFDDYLGKTFSAGMRSSAGKSSSALLRQASRYLSKSVFYDNITKGVSSVLGSMLSFGNLAR